jgi:hypothetical protein
MDDCWTWPRRRAPLSRLVYNVTSFSLSAQDIYEHCRRAFPAAEVTVQPDRKRQGIVDSWPQNVDDSAGPDLRPKRARRTLFQRR